ncbi:hypothetical protein AB7M33_002378 [Pseudomonas sp. Y3 TE3536]
MIGRTSCGHSCIHAVRLQELFGLAGTPRIAQGRQQVKLHLPASGRGDSSSEAQKS